MWISRTVVRAVSGESPRYAATIRIHHVIFCSPTTLLALPLRYGGQPQYEIEARVKDVDAAVFASMLRKLQSNQNWLDKSTTVTVDSNFNGGIRQTSTAGHAPQYLRKSKVDQLDVYTSDGERIRFSVCCEERLAPAEVPSLSHSDLRVVRVKTRHSFNHKGEVLFELTEVKSGSSESEALRAYTEYEVELEWCGQAVASRYSSDLLLRKFAAKVADLLAMKMAAEGGA